ncbi:MAG: hypothetical protein FWH27_12155 [Planctomycetaceae bacterium]|nr:hypothetical protein [Planctomycetaceae bacterium]
MSIRGQKKVSGEKAGGRSPSGYVGESWLVHQVRSTARDRPEVGHPP